MRSKLLVLGAVAIVLAIGSVVQAGTIYTIQTTGADFDTLLGGSLTPVEAALVSDFSGGGFSASVVSQAFTDGAGHYLYLYQVNNTGAPDTDIITRFTANPFPGADAGISLGYLDANVPASFVMGDQPPLYADVNAALNPTVGFDFPVGNPLFGLPDAYIAPGKSSMVLYVESDLAPGLVTGNIIDGQVRAGSVIGPVPVPEPGTLVLLVTAGLGVLVCVWRKRAA